MKTPAEKCAERIWDSVGILSCFSKQEWQSKIATIIQSEYAETFKVAREAMENALTYVAHGSPSSSSKVNYSGLIIQLRTAMELIPK